MTPTGLTLNVTLANSEKYTEYGDGYGPEPRYEVIARYRQTDIAKVVAPIECVQDAVRGVLDLFTMIKDGIDQATDAWLAAIDETPADAEGVRGYGA